MKQLVILITIIFSWISSVAAQEDGHVGKKILVQPTGEYAKIDVKLANDTIDILLDVNNKELIDKTVSEIIAVPQNYAPPVLYMLAYTLFSQDRKDEAMFWFYAGQLRARYDANRCADVSARSAVGALNDKIGPVINPYAFKDMAKLKETIYKVLDWEKTTPFNYDHRWINLHGLNALMGGLGGEEPTDPLSLPQGEWDAIHQKTLDDYLAGFNQALAMMEEKAKNESQE